MKDKNNLEVSDYQTLVSGNLFVNIPENQATLSFEEKIEHIVINDNITDLHIKYKGKEYVFDLEKALMILCKELEKWNTLERKTEYSKISH